MSNGIGGGFCVVWWCGEGVRLSLVKERKKVERGRRREGGEEGELMTKINRGKFTLAP